MPKIPTERSTSRAGRGGLQTTRQPSVAPASPARAYHGGTGPDVIDPQPHAIEYNVNTPPTIRPAPQPTATPNRIPTASGQPSVSDASFTATEAASILSTQQTLQTPAQVAARVQIEEFLTRLTSQNSKIKDGPGLNVTEIEVTRSQKVLTKIAAIRQALNDDRCISFLRCAVSVLKTNAKSGSLDKHDLDFFANLTMFPSQQLEGVLATLGDSKLQDSLSYEEKISLHTLLHLMIPDLTHFLNAIEVTRSLFPNERKWHIETVQIIKRLTVQESQQIKAIFATWHFSPTRATYEKWILIQDNLRLIKRNLPNSNFGQILSFLEWQKSIYNLGFYKMNLSVSNVFDRIYNTRGGEFLDFLQSLDRYLLPFEFIFKKEDNLEKYTKIFLENRSQDLLDSFKNYLDAFRTSNHLTNTIENNSAAIRSSGFQSILSTPESGIIDHAHSLTQSLRLRAGPVNTAPNSLSHHRVDLENVMQSTSIQRTVQSILALDALFKTRPPSKDLISNIVNYLSKYPATASPNEKSVFVRVRGGSTELMNAARTLIGPTHPGDFSAAIVTNPAYDLGSKKIGLADLTALVWYAIDQYNPPHQSADATANDKNLMRFSVFKALSQCIEDDGHRVCAVGFTQRITTTLQGYYTDVVKIDDESTVPPEAFFTQLCSRFDRALPQDYEPTQEVLHAFVRYTLRQATQLYGPGSAQLSTVKDMLAAYMRITYDWTSLSFVART